MSKNNSQYYKDLSNNKLSLETINTITPLFEKYNLTLKELDKKDKQLLTEPVITDKLTKLKLYVCLGNKSWEGLVVGFPGTDKDLNSRNMTTPYIRHILYPMLDLQKRLRDYHNKAMPCIYIIGERFDDVFLRKIRLLNIRTSHLIILTGDLYRCIKTQTELPNKGKVNTESAMKYRLCYESKNKNLIIPAGKENGIDFRYICNELPAYQGTEKPERLDILGYNNDPKDKSLIAFELKKPDTKDRVDLENLFFQGLEHLNWLEENKMAVKFMFEGPRGNKINTKKRVKLVLGYGGENTPQLFKDFRIAMKKDPYQEIVFYDLNNFDKNNY